MEWLGDWSRAHTEMRRSSPNSLSSPLAGGSINFQLLEYVLCNRCNGNRSLDEAAEAADRCRTDSYRLPHVQKVFWLLVLRTGHSIMLPPPAARQSACTVVLKASCHPFTVSEPVWPSGKALGW